MVILVLGTVTPFTLPRRPASRGWLPTMTLFVVSLRLQLAGILASLRPALRPTARLRNPLSFCLLHVALLILVFFLRTIGRNKEAALSTRAVVSHLDSAVHIRIILQAVVRTSPSFFSFFCCLCLSNANLSFFSVRCISLFLHVCFDSDA